MQKELKGFQKHSRRESWLNAVAAEFQAVFFNGRLAPELPKSRFSCGFPKGRSKAIGQCFAAEASADHHYEIFVSPELDDSLRVGDVLLHECIHAAVGLECKHRGAFRKTAIACGLTGPMNATFATPELVEKLEKIVAKVGHYPHAQLMAANLTKKQTTRQILLKCQNEDCGMKIRTTRKWLDEVGAPTCACGGEFDLEEQPQ